MMENVLAFPNEKECIVTSLEKTESMIKVKEIIPGGKLVLLIGEICEMSEINVLFSVLGRIINANKGNISVVISKNMNMYSEVEKCAKENGISDYLYRISEPEILADKAIECIELPSLALGSFFFRKKKILISNEYTPIYKLLNDIIGAVD